ncbi:MAG: hypothetical protein K5905_06790 [Roseibium sp.]|uniref:hypothetical protein n=1 Tax=Roseibium sp. TaxID=1936156 RepID=UPI002627C870|nr:hypothetical protein [Roseibium sp.]MCV0425160.1 hypothetical protein [Roseibium sp.]
MRVFRSSNKNEKAALNAPREVIFEGEDLSRTFFNMAGMAQGIAEQKTKYNAGSNNSNTLVDRIVQWSGGHAPRLGKTHWSPGSVNLGDFRPEFYSKMPPVLWGAETYSKHRDVVDDLFNKPAGKAGQAQTRTQKQLRTAKVDWGATDRNIRERHIKDKKLAADMISDLANAKTLQGAWGDDFKLKYEDYLIFESVSAGPGATQTNSSTLDDTSVQKSSSGKTKQALGTFGWTPINSGNVPNNGASHTGSLSKSDNPFNVSNPNLKQQAEMLERNPVRARQLIVAARRDPEAFGLTKVAQ